MKKYFQNITVIVIFLSNICNAATKDDSIKYARFNFNLGLNANWITDDTRYENGFTGFGLLFEPRIGDSFSIVISYNKISLTQKNNYNISNNDNEINTTNFNLLLRWRFIGGRFAFYPEIGLGNWGEEIGLGMFGLGLEYRLYKKLYGSINFDRVGWCNGCMNVGGGGSSGNHFRIVVSLAYLIELKKEINHF